MAGSKKRAAAQESAPSNYPTKGEVRRGITPNEVYRRAVAAQARGEIGGLSRYTPAEESPHDTDVRRLLLVGQREEVGERLADLTAGAVGGGASTLRERRRNRVTRAMRRIDTLLG